MPKYRTNRSTFDRNDPYRALITDTSTDDVPIIFSNDGFRSNLQRQREMSPDARAMVKSALLSLGDGYTLPYRYRISHRGDSFRQLALAHPASQIRTANLYEEYADLITYYCSRSKFSLRYPTKVASSFYYKNPLADINKYRDSSVLLEPNDKLFKHPSSYFAYSGKIDRYYKYFQSDDFYSMEKKYKYMLKIDVAKCFSSIYTHTISWAIKDIDHGKKHTKSVSIGNALDTCMQRMNYNETNGILIGPEFSRIFAEILFQSIDQKIEKTLLNDNLTLGRDYDIRRYIDDYLIFTIEERNLGKIKLAVGESLANFNMHLNESKTESYSRPFQTAEAAVIDAAMDAFNLFWNENTIKVERNQRRFTIADKIGSHGRLAKSFLRSIKTVCHENGTDYGSVAPVLVSAIDERIQRIVDSFDNGVIHHDKIKDQVLVMMSLLEISYFLYSVKPSVSSSYRIGRSTILALRFCEANKPEFLPVLSEHILQQSKSFFEAADAHYGHRQMVPIDRINLMVSLTELPHEYFAKLGGVVRRMAETATDYFEIIAVLFCAGRGKLLTELRSTINQSVSRIIERGLRPHFSAHDCFLSFDLLSCPYLQVEVREKVLGASFSGLSLAKLAEADGRALIAELETHPWFVKWDRIDLLREMSKRELNQVY